MRKVVSLELRPGMITAEPVYSLDGRQVLLPAGLKLSETSIRLIRNWDIHYVTIAEEREASLSVEPPARPVEPDYSKLPEVLAKKSIDFASSLETAIAQVETMFDEVRDSGKLDMNSFREVAAQVAKYLILPSEAINRLLFRSRSRSSRNYLAYHSICVAALAGMLAKWLELAPARVNEIILAALLHDAGKTQIPRALIADANPTPERQQMIKQHVPAGLHLLNELPGLSQDLLAGVVQHHECMDGSGYPLAMSGDQIHFYARIVAVANRLSHFADGRGGLNPFMLADTIKSEMFTKLDPAVCDTFIRHFTDYLMNNPVRLSDGRIANVVFLPSVNPTSPVLKTDDGEFVDIAKNKEIRIMGLTF